MGLILSDHGIAVTVPSGWDARLFQRAEIEVATPGDPDTPVGGFTSPILHLGNFDLPTVRGDYGSGAVDIMGPDHVFVALVEFAADSVGQPMFNGRGLPQLRGSDFAPATMQRPTPPRSGAQRFFVEQGRAFCLYAVIGSHTRRQILAPHVAAAVAAIVVSPRD